MNLTFGIRNPSAVSYPNTHPPAGANPAPAPHTPATPNTKDPSDVDVRGAAERIENPTFSGFLRNNHPPAGVWYIDNYRKPNDDQPTQNRPLYPARPAYRPASKQAYSAPSRDRNGPKSPANRAKQTQSTRTRNNPKAFYRKALHQKWPNRQAKKQTQSNPIPLRKPPTGRRHPGPVPSNAEGFRATARAVPVPVLHQSPGGMSNKANLRRFWAGNEDHAEKQSQFKANLGRTRVSPTCAA